MCVFHILFCGGGGRRHRRRGLATEDLLLFLLSLLFYVFSSSSSSSFYFGCCCCSRFLFIRIFTITYHNVLFIHIRQFHHTQNKRSLYKRTLRVSFSHFVLFSVSSSSSSSSFLVFFRKKVYKNVKSFKCL